MLTKQQIISLLFITPFACSSQLYADDHEHEEHGAHVHGEAQLLLAIEGNTLEIEFHSPAMNIVGFEHKPSNDAQEQAVKLATATLKKPELLFGLPATAKCESVSAKVESPLAKHDDHEHEHAQNDDHTKDESHDHEEGEHKHEHKDDGEEHSDITGHYKFSCTNMSQLKSIEIEIFKQFPGTESIEVQSITHKGQNKTDLSPQQSTLNL